jgi:hypothetical protein
VRLSVNPSAGVAFSLDEAAPVHPREEDLPLVEVPAGLIKHSVYLPVITRDYDPSLLFFDDFSDPSSGWSDTDEGDFQYSYEDGEYEISAALSGWLVGTGAPLEALSGNYSVEVDARRLSGSDVQYGIELENEESWDSYWFVVRPGSQSYALWLSDNDELTWLDGGISPYINPGDATNHLKAERLGSEIVVSVNGQILTSVVDTTHLGGWVGLAIWAGNSVPAVARFDNYAVRRPDGGMAVTAARPEKRVPPVPVPILVQPQP